MVGSRAMPAPLCPCSSGAAYRDCCAPFHRGAEPPTPQALVRSRYAAFALGEIDYLYRTLHGDHPDRLRHGRDHVLAALRAASSTFRYLGLALWDERDADADGVAHVLYRARLFRRGADVSFVELADFAREADGWRYLAGVTVDAAKVDDEPTARSIDGFRAARR